MVATKTMFVVVAMMVLAQEVVSYHDTYHVPTGVVTCSNTGYAVNFTLDYVNNTVAEWSVVIGNNDNNACNESLKTIINETTGNEHLFSEIPYDTCGGGVWENTTLINDLLTYCVNVTVHVDEIIRDVIKRRNTYQMQLKCMMNRTNVDSAAQHFENTGVVKEIQEVVGANNTFDLPVEINYYTDNNYNVQKGSPFSVNMGEELYVKINEETSNTDFKFVVQDCWFNTNSDPDHSPPKDDFFKNECPVDDTFDFAPAIPDAFRFQIQSFSFNGHETSDIYLHCKVYICRQDDTSAACVQKTKADCTGSKRRRRSADSAIEAKTITAPVVRVMESIVPTCAENYVYDRTTKTCTAENILEIRGVYLDLPWNNDYYIPESQVFQDFAQTVGYQLYALAQSVPGGEGIEGVKVISAKKGSVILNVQIKYADHLDVPKSFNVFETAVRTTHKTRIANLLNIRQEKVIEYITLPSTSGSSPSVDQTQLIIIVVVVVLIAVLFISGLTIWKVSSLRRRTTVEAPPVKSYDNAGL